MARLSAIAINAQVDRYGLIHGRTVTTAATRRPMQIIQAVTSLGILANLGVAYGQRGLCVDAPIMLYREIGGGSRGSERLLDVAAVVQLWAVHFLTINARATLMSGTPTRATDTDQCAPK